MSMKQWECLVKHTKSNYWSTTHQNKKFNKNTKSIGLSIQNLIRIQNLLGQAPNFWSSSLSTGLCTFSYYFDNKTQSYKIYQYALIKQQYPLKAKTSKSHFVFKPHADLPTKQPILFLHLTSYIKCGNQNKNKKIFDVHITSPLL